VPLAGGSYISFIKARIARLYPLHLFCLLYLFLFQLSIMLVYGVLGRASPFGWGYDEIYGLIAQALLLNAYLPIPPMWNVPTWSISAEALAYLLFPVAFMILGKNRRLAIVILSVLPLVFYASILAGISPDGRSLDITVGLGWLRCLAGFFTGMILFSARAIFARAGSLGLSALQIVAVAAVLLGLAMPVADPLIIPAFVLLIGSTWPDRGIVARALNAGPFLWLGEISYSIYLNHVCVVKILGFFWSRVRVFDTLPPSVVRLGWIVLVYTVTILLSWWTYRHVERNGRRWLARWWASGPVAPIASSPPAP
jgi:peptidoglycan/LPS O-acetylase OafA/YrhL